MQRVYRIFFWCSWDWKRIQIVVEKNVQICVRHMQTSPVKAAGGRA